LIPRHQPSEIRIDPVTGRTVIIAPGRAERPMPLVHAEPHHRPPRHRSSERATCPFCPGNAHDTPAESYAIREAGTAADGPGWSLRVVPNKFPAVEAFGSSAFGIHEVVIPCPEHESNPTQLSDGQLAALLIAIRERLRSYASDDRVLYAQAFQNVGAEAGASLDHLHAQLLATPFVPEAIDQELAGSKRYFETNGTCVFCHLAAQASVVFRDVHFIALCPPAPRFAYESWIVPLRHDSDFRSLKDAECASLATSLKRLLAAIDRVLHEPAYNIILHTAPFRMGPLPSFHWHLEIIPRTSRAAGFEWGTGVFINTVPPEWAAKEFAGR
jgi:UDPglucose--hexose-1-phosphate uridylyltransferase